jgi:hypothetical protein
MASAKQHRARRGGWRMKRRRERRESAIMKASAQHQSNGAALSEAEIAIKEWRRKIIGGGNKA